MARREEERLEDLRRRVEETTKEIFTHVAYRTRLVKEIGRLKAALKLPVEDASYEAALRERLLRECRSLELDESFATRLLNLLIHEAIREQRGPGGESRESGLSMIVHRARQLAREGQKIIRLDLGEPDFGAPQRVREAVSKAARAGRAHYTDPRGILELRAALARHLMARFGVELTERNVLVTMGARLGIYLTMLSLIRPGDEAIILYPAWPAYRQCVDTAGGRAVAVETTLEEKWGLPTERIAQRTTPATKVVVLNNPNNPTGKVFDRESLQWVVDFARERGVTVLSDEVYSDYSFSEFHSIVEYDDVSYVYVSSLSKSHGMTGYRIGYVVSDEEVIERMARLQSLIITSLPEFVQLAALEALRCIEDVKRNVQKMRRRMKVAVQALRRLPVDFVEPDGGFYLFPRVLVRGFDSERFARELLEKKHVAVAPGLSYGSYGDYLRIAVCQPSSKLVEGIRRIGELLA